MTDQERDIITRFIARIGGNPAQPAAFGSVPATAAAPLPPIDKDADTLIAQLFTQYPEARYRLTQLAFVQEHAVAEAQNRINQLQQQLRQAEQAAQAAQTPPASPWGQAARGGFGQQAAASPQYAVPPQPYPPQAYPPQGYPQVPPAGMMQPQGTGFLGSALRTAAGVAGGVFVGNALMDMFSGGRGAGFGGGMGAGGFGGTPGTVINETNVYEQAPAASAPAASPWADTPVPPVPPTDANWGGAPNPGFDPNLRQADWADPAAADPGFDTSDSGGGFDDSSA